MNVAPQATQPNLSYDELLAKFRDLTAQNAFLLRQNRDLIQEKDYLEELVRHLQRQRYARSSEVVPSGQGTLFNEAELIAETEAPASEPPTSAPAEDQKKPGKKRKRGRPVRKPLPDYLPRVHKTIDLPQEEKSCPKSGQPLKQIGEEVSSVLDIEPMKATVVVTHRLKYGACDCQHCTGGTDAPVIKTAPVEKQPIPKSMAAPGLLAYIAVSKYADALPLARQEEIFKRHGIDLVRSTMASWIIKLGVLVVPLINLIREELLKGKVIQADETRIQVHKGKRLAIRRYRLPSGCGTRS